MGCTTCGSSRTFVRARLNRKSQDAMEAVGECEFTNEMLFTFDEKLTWFKETASYIQYNIEASLLNKYLGLVKTSLNIQNKCYYHEELVAIETLVNFIIMIQNGI